MIISADMNMPSGVRSRGSSAEAVSAGCDEASEGTAFELV
jgi:hypothetical protein